MALFPIVRQALAVRSGSRCAPLRRAARAYTRIDTQRFVLDSICVACNTVSVLLPDTPYFRDLTVIGGVALQRGIVRALEERLKVNLHVPPDCQYVCALGAALLRLRRIEAVAA